MTDAVGEVVVTRDHLDLRPAELRTELTKRLFGLHLGQTAVIAALVNRL